MTDSHVEPATCGTGLAAHAPLPALMGRLTEAVAEVLETHLLALDPSNHAAREELAAYVSLVAAHRRIAAALHATAHEMAGYQTLPEAPHDMTALADPRATAAYAAFVELETELRALLDQRLTDDRQLLQAMREQPSP